MQTAYYISVFLHVLAAILWIGGMFFFGFILLPFLRSPKYKDVIASFLLDSGVKFRLISWHCFAVFVITGVINIHYRGYTWGNFSDGTLFAGPFGKALAIKLVFVSAIFVLSAIHDFYIGPKATRLWEDKNADPALVAHNRKLAGWFGRINALLALATLYTAVALARQGF